MAIQSAASEAAWTDIAVAEMVSEEEEVVVVTVEEEEGEEVVAATRLSQARTAMPVLLPKRAQITAPLALAAIVTPARMLVVLTRFLLQLPLPPLLLLLLLLLLLEEEEEGECQSARQEVATSSWT